MSIYYLCASTIWLFHLLFKSAGKGNPNTFTDLILHISMCDSTVASHNPESWEEHNNVKIHTLGQLFSLYCHHHSLFPTLRFQQWAAEASKHSANMQQHFPRLFCQFQTICSSGDIFILSGMSWFFLPQLIGPAKFHIHVGCQYPLHLEVKNCIAQLSIRCKRKLSNFLSAVFISQFLNPALENVLDRTLTPALPMYVLLWQTHVLSLLSRVLCKDGRSWSLLSDLVQEQFSASLSCSRLSLFRAVLLNHSFCF